MYHFKDYSFYLTQFANQLTRNTYFWVSHILRFLEIWQHIFPAPSRIAEIGPVIVILFMAPDVPLAVYRARAAHYFSRRVLEGPAHVFSAAFYTFRLSFVSVIHARVQQKWLQPRYFAGEGLLATHFQQ